ncbi:MAG: LysM peptidoglycan-binding domain-containing protein [Anaerotignaceae bacterium]
MYSFNLDEVTLPIAPSKLIWKINNKNSTLDLVNGGEINFLRSSGLTEFTFEMLIPVVEYPFAKYTDGFKSADYYLEAFENFKQSKNPLLFSVVRNLPNGKAIFETSMKVSLEEYKISEEAKEGFDIKVDVTLLQYVPIKTIAYTIEESSQEEVAVIGEAITRGVEKEIPKTYIVKKGDSLWAICKAHFGDGGKYKEIATLNGISNPNLIYVGQVIRLE